jgi:hypothetical protein
VEEGLLEFVEGSEFALVKRIDPVPFLNQSIYAFDYALLHRHGRHGNRDSGKRSLIQALNVGTVSAIDQLPTYPSRLQEVANVRGANTLIHQTHLDSETRVRSLLTNWPNEKATPDQRRIAIGANKNDITLVELVSLMKRAIQGNPVQ